MRIELTDPERNGHKLNPMRLNVLHAQIKKVVDQVNAAFTGLGADRPFLIHTMRATETKQQARSFTPEIINEIRVESFYRLYIFSTNAPPKRKNTLEPGEGETLASTAEALADLIDYTRKGLEEILAGLPAKLKALEMVSASLRGTN